MDSDLDHLFDDGTNLEVPFEIIPPLSKAITCDTTISI